MKRRRHTPEQIVRKLRDADMMLTDGVKAEVYKSLEISEATYHRWQALGGMSIGRAQRLMDARPVLLCAPYPLQPLDRALRAVRSAAHRIRQTSVGG